jgi:hypothetical protein
VKAILTHHAKIRLKERTDLSVEDFLTLLDTFRTSSVGYEPNTFRWHRLFYSRPDDEHFVAIQDIATGEVITILSLDYHENLAWKIGTRRLRQAIWRADPNRHAELYLQQPSPTGQKFEVTGVFWTSQVRTAKHNLGSYRFSTPLTSAHDASDNDEFIATVFSRVQKKNLHRLPLDELLLYDRRSDTLYKIPSQRIADFSLAADDTTNDA